MPPKQPCRINDMTLSLPQYDYRAKKPRYSGIPARVCRGASAAATQSGDHRDAASRPDVIPLCPAEKMPRKPPGSRQRPRHGRVSRLLAGHPWAAHPYGHVCKRPFVGALLNCNGPAQSTLECARELIEFRRAHAKAAPIERHCAMACPILRRSCRARGTRTRKYGRAGISASIVASRPASSDHCRPEPGGCYGRRHATKMGRSSVAALSSGKHGVITPPW